LDADKLIADRMKLIESSGIRKVFDLAQTLTNPVNLSIGQPHFDVAEPVKAKAMQAIESGCNKYTVTQGIEELRARVLALEKARSGICHESVLITAGVSGGLLLALMALVNPGDGVIIPDPYFVMYKHLCRLLGGKPIYVDTYPDFRLTAAMLDNNPEARKAKLLILNSPNNPTGQVIGPQDLKEITEWARKNNIFIISDEIYRDFVYDGQYVSTAQFTEDILLLNGFSKSAGMTGWRLGYAIGPQPIIAEMTKLQQFTFVCAPSIVQYAGLVALELDCTSHVKAYQAKRDMVYEGLKGKFELEEPKGAFYAFVRAPGDDGDAFVQKAIEHGLLIIPGSVFSEKRTHFRLSFAAEDETIEAGVRVLCSLA